MSDVGITDDELAHRLYEKQEEDNLFRIRCPNSECGKNFRVTPVPDKVATEQRLKDSLGMYREKARLSGVVWTLKPLLSYLMSSRYYYLKGFSIVERKGGSDRIQCDECDEMYTPEQVFH